MYYAITKSNMIFKCEKKAHALIIISIIFANFKLLQSTELNIYDICQLSKQRYPDHNHNVNNILQSYKICLQQLRAYSGTTKESLLRQLLNKVECFKGDLKQSYYAGKVNYSDIERVETMAANIENTEGDVNHETLHNTTTNNKCDYTRFSRSTDKQIIPLALTGTLSEKQKACNAIFKRDKVGGNITLEDIPTPTLDNNIEPRELTVPLTNPCTYRVDSPEAENALTQYYKVVMKCLTLTTEHKIQVFRFNKRFYEWLTQAVLPHLKDDKCYPAFGGVLRIVETMREKEFVPKNATANFIFYRQRNLEKSDEELRKDHNFFRKIFLSFSFILIVGPMILIIALILIFIGWRLGICCVGCCEHKKIASESSATEVFYYPIEETPSVSLNMDDVSSESLYSDKTDKGSKMNNRQRGGYDSQVYSMIYGQDNTLTALPLKRHWPSKSSSSNNELQSPGKRQKKFWSNK